MVEATAVLVRVLRVFKGDPITGFGTSPSYTIIGPYHDYFKRFPRSVMMENEKLVLCSWLRAKQLPIKVKYLYVLTSPLKRKFHVYSNTDLNRFHLKTERHNFFWLEFLGNDYTWEYKFIKLYEKSWPKFEQVSKKYRPLGSGSRLLSKNNPLLIVLLSCTG